MPVQGRKGPIPQTVPISMSGGIETKVDPNQVAPPKTLIADNIRMTTTGAVRKRYGLTALPPPQTGYPIDVGASNRELCATQNNRFYAYDPDNTAWRNIAELYTTGLSSKAITTLAFPPGIAISSAVSAPTWAIVGTTAVMTYTFLVGTQNYVALTCFDTTSGVVYWTREFNDLGRATSPSYFAIGNVGAAAPTVGTTRQLIAPKIIAYKGVFVWACLQYDNSGNYYVRAFSFGPTQSIAQSPNLYSKANCTVLDGTSATFPTLWAPTTQPGFDMSANSTDFVLAAIAKASGSSTPAGAAIRSNGTLPAASSIAAGGGSGNPAAGPYYVKTSMAENVFVALITEPRAVSYLATVTGPVSGWGATTALNGFAQTNTQPPSTSPTSSVGLSVPYSANIADTGTGTNWTFTVSDGYTVCNGTGDNTSSGTPTMTTFSNVAPVMNALNTSSYSNQGWSNVASQIFLIGGVPHMWIANGGPGYLFINYLLVNLADNNVVAHTYYLRSRLFTNADNRAPQVHVTNGVPATLLLETFGQSFNANLVSLVPQVPQYIRTPSGTLITGSDTKYYDGQLLRSAGWEALPQLGTLSVTGTTGGSLAPSTTYSYIYVLVDYDGSGNALISSPSQPYSVTLGSSSTATNSDLTALIPPYLPSNTGPAIEIYRNTANDQLNYHLVTTLFVANLGNTTYKDITSDAGIASNRLLYSPPSGGELPNDPAPPSTCGVSTKTRAFLASAEHGSWLYYSKPFFAGRGPEFNAGSFIDVEPATGDIIGLAALDEVIIVFKRKYIYLLSGTGPDATGAGTFNPLSNISTDRGLQDPNSLVTSNDGVYFRSQRGIEIIDRGYSISYIGAPVERLINASTVESAVSAADSSQVRFALTSGQSVVYDYTTAAWTTYTYALNTLPAPLQVTSQASFNGLNYIAANTSIGGEVYYEDRKKYIDDAAPYIMAVQTAYVPIAGPQGWGRIRRANILGTAKDACTIQVYFLYDYGQDTRTPQSFSITQPGAFNLRIRAPRQVCQSVSIKVAVSTPSGTSEGIVLSDIVLETSAKSGDLRVPDTQSI